MGDTGGLFEEALDAGAEGWVLEIDVGDLVIGDGEGLTGSGVEEFEAEFVANGEVAVLAQEAVEVDGMVDGGDAVFGDDPGFDAALLEEADQVIDEGIDEAKVSGDVGVMGAEALEVVIEVGEVDELEGGLVVLFDPAGGGGDPLGGGVGGALGAIASGDGSPEGGEREPPEFLYDPGAEGGWVRVDVEQLASIGAVDGAGGDGVIHVGVHIEPPEQLGDGEPGDALAEQVPDLGAGDEVVGLFPEVDLGEFAVIPAVADDAVRGGQLAGEIIGLGGAGDCGERRFDEGLGSLLAQVCKGGCICADEGIGEPDDVKECESFGHGVGAWGATLRVTSAPRTSRRPNPRRRWRGYENRRCAA
jgi:hypothetical protein